MCILVESVYIIAAIIFDTSDATLALFPSRGRNFTQKKLRFLSDGDPKTCTRLQMNYSTMTMRANFGKCLTVTSVKINFGETALSSTPEVFVQQMDLCLGNQSVPRKCSRPPQSSVKESTYLCSKSESKAVDLIVPVDVSICEIIIYHMQRPGIAINEQLLFMNHK